MRRAEVRPISRRREISDLLIPCRKSLRTSAALIAAGGYLKEPPGPRYRLLRFFHKAAIFAFNLSSFSFLSINDSLSCSKKV
jgi:hypothetical protein